MEGRPVSHVAASGTEPPVRRARGVYAITPDEADTARLLARVQPVLAAGITWLQYRNKTADAELRREQACALLDACRAAGVPLILNDDWRLAAAIGADGAHVGEHDGELTEARAALPPGALVGASCYDELQRARDAVRAGASYVAFGAFHPSTTKPGARRARPALLRDAAALGVPRVAIGGIDAGNAPALVDAGADLVAMISGIFDAADPVQAVRVLRACFDMTCPPSSLTGRDSTLT